MAEDMQAVRQHRPIGRYGTPEPVHTQQSGGAVPQGRSRSPSLPPLRLPGVPVFGEHRLATGHEGVQQALLCRPAWWGSHPRQQALCGPPEATGSTLRARLIDTCARVSGQSKEGSLQGRLWWSFESAYWCMVSQLQH